MASARALLTNWLCWEACMLNAVSSRRISSVPRFEFPPMLIVRNRPHQDVLMTFRRIVAVSFEHVLMPFHGTQQCAQSGHLGCRKVANAGVIVQDLGQQRFAYQTVIGIQRLQGL